MRALRLDRLVRRVVIIEALVAALLVTVSVGVVVSGQKVEQRSDEVSETLLDLQAVRGEVLSAETGLRGYILSGRLAFLQPYLAGERRVEQGVRRVTERMPAEHRAEARDLGTRFARWRTTFAEPVLARIAAGDRSGAQPMIVAGVGKAQIDAIRGRIADLSARERERLRDEQDRAGLVQAVGLSVIALLSLTAVAVGFLLLRVLRRQVVHPVEGLATASGAFGAGDLAARAPVAGVMEARVAAEAFNEMAGRLGRTVADLRELDELKSRFVSTVSHELRTPLTSIMGFADELTEEAGTLSESQREAVEVIVRNAGHLEAIINDLLLLSSLESGRVQLTRDALDVGALATELCRELEPQARERGITLRTELGPRLAVRGDRQRLRQALANLVNNAIKFSPGDAEVVVRATRSAEDVVIAVRDSGPGIPETEHAQLGHRFFRASTATGVSGTGLGLAITREIVERHHGRLEIESELGRGSTFRLVLPVTARDERDPAPPQLRAAT
ncbi:ATP-binding protein [Paraconexibacter sp.]|uniref:sensor histidine kinase n=1 Tax=Paraconexibacter sp. TaxID=2949640 RepID=UPI0035620C59